MRLHIELCEIQPKIYRKVDVHRATSLEELHDVIQDAFGWWNYHLWTFKIKESTYGQRSHWEEVADELNIRDAHATTVGEVYELGVKQFLYIYDMGDHWEHAISFNKPRKQEPGVAYPVLVDAKRNCPPEDVGGVTGYFDYLAILADKTHEDHQDMLSWRGEYDPESVTTNLPWLD